MRRYKIEISPETNIIRICESYEEISGPWIECDLGDEPGKRVYAVGFIAGVMKLLPLEKVMPSKIEKGN